MKQYEQEQAKLKQLGFYPGTDEGLGHQQPHPVPPGHVHPAPDGAHRKDQKPTVEKTMKASFAQRDFQGGRGL